MTKEELEDLFGFGIVEIYEILQDHEIDLKDDEAIRLLADQMELI